MTAGPLGAIASQIIILHWGAISSGHTIYSGENGSISVDVDPDTMRRLWDNFYVPLHQRVIIWRRGDSAAMTLKQESRSPMSDLPAELSMRTGSGDL